MKRMFVVIVVVISSTSFCMASEVQPSEENSEHINISAKLEKKLMENIVNKMQLVGRINSDEVAKAKKEISSLKFSRGED